MLDWHSGAPWVARVCTRTAPRPVSCPDSGASSVRKSAPLFFFALVEPCSRRRYDPAASCPLGSTTAPSVLTARLQERREGSHLRAAVQFVAVAGIRISFQLLAEIPGIFFSVLVPPPLPETNLPACTAVSCWLRLTLSTRLLPKVRFGRWKTRLHLCD